MTKSYALLVAVAPGWRHLVPSGCDALAGGLVGLDNFLLPRYGCCGTKVPSPGSPPGPVVADNPYCHRKLDLPPFTKSLNRPRSGALTLYPGFRF